MKQSNPKEVIQATALQQVNFKDGMIVTAEDLQDASNYPLGVFKTLIRAFFGCGIVCGLEVKPVGFDEDQNTWCVEIKPGTALDCHGHPLELCKPVKFDLSDACGCAPNPPTCVCIAIRRYTSEESPRPNPSCSDDNKGQDYDCTRIKEQVLIKAYDPNDSEERPKNICMQDIDGAGCCGNGNDQVVNTESQPAASDVTSERNRGLEELCKCMMTCPDKDCCGDSWVLLACIKLDECGVVQTGTENRLRKYVKPISCLCDLTTRKSQAFAAASVKSQFPNEFNLATDASLAQSAVQEAAPDKTPATKKSSKPAARAKKS